MATPAEGRCATPPAAGSSRPGAPRLQPTWADYSGGDSFTAVAVTGPAVYVGGHPRWLNNPRSDGSNFTASTRPREHDPGRDRRPRPGQRPPAALEPRAGTGAREPGRSPPLRTACGSAATPTRPAGGPAPGCEGCEFHQKLAFFPLAGGATLAPPATGRAPGRPHRRRSGRARQTLLRRGDARRRRRFWERAPTAAGSGARSGSAGRLYEGRDDGRLLRWNYDGASFGPVDPGRPAQAPRRAPDVQRHRVRLPDQPGDRHVRRQRPPLLQPRGRPEAVLPLLPEPGGRRRRRRRRPGPRGQRRRRRARLEPGPGDDGRRWAHLLVGGRRPAPHRLRRREAEARHPGDRRRRR